jgi:hypothetical protein
MSVDEVLEKTCRKSKEERASYSKQDEAPTLKNYSGTKTWIVSL